MTYKLAFNESALKEWKKLGHTIQEQFKKKQRIAVFPAERHSLYEEHGYSAAIRSGDLLFVSGQVGSHTDGTPEPDFQKQVRFALSLSFKSPEIITLLFGKNPSKTILINLFCLVLQINIWFIIVLSLKQITSPSLI